jgi:hypothetical protein
VPRVWSLAHGGVAGLEAESRRQAAMMAYNGAFLDIAITAGLIILLIPLMRAPKRRPNEKGAR